MLRSGGRARMLSGNEAAVTDKIAILKTDITTLAVDAIVNAANTTLLGEAALMGRSIARLGRSCWWSAGR